MVPQILPFRLLERADQVFVRFRHARPSSAVTLPRTALRRHAVHRPASRRGRAGPGTRHTAGPSGTGAWGLLRLIEGWARTDLGIIPSARSRGKWAGRPHVIESPCPDADRRCP